MKLVKVTGKVAGVDLSLWGWDESHIIKTMRRRGSWYEAPLLNAIADLGIEGVYVDVGANIGTHTVAFSRCCPSTRVISVEPWESNIKILRKNANMVKNEIRKAYLTEEPRFITGPKLEITRSTTMDELLADVVRIHLAKIDVAIGGTMGVLRGGASIITRDKPVLAVETTNQEEYQQLLSWATMLGYEKLGTYGATPTHLLRQA